MNAWITERPSTILYRQCRPARTQVQSNIVAISRREQRSCDMKFAASSPELLWKSRFAKGVASGGNNTRPHSSSLCRPVLRHVPGDQSPKVGGNRARAIDTRVGILDSSGISVNVSGEQTPCPSMTITAFSCWPKAPFVGTRVPPNKPRISAPTPTVAQLLECRPSAIRILVVHLEDSFQSRQTIGDSRNPFSGPELPEP